MSKFKLGDLIRPKKNPTYLPDEVKIITGFSNDGEFFEAMSPDGSEKYSQYYSVENWRHAYPVPVLVGDTVRLRDDMNVWDLFEEIEDGELINQAVCFFGANGGEKTFRVCKSSDGYVRVESPQNDPLPACIFAPVERAVAKMMTHAEIEAALGFRFEMEDD